MRPPYAHSRTRLFWAAAVFAAAGYGLFLVVTAVRLRSGAELTGQFALQPAVKALTGGLLAVAAPTRADLVGPRHVAATHHGGILLRPAV
jgi:hypothetical protein